jgi:hypothetical protein
MNMTKRFLTLVFAGALIFAFAEARAAQQGATQPAAPEVKPEPGAAPGAAGTEGAKPEEGTPAQAPAGAEAPQPQIEGAPKSLAELTRDGFEIVTTDFIPAEAVTRQSGKVSSDAIVLTGATAV